jgi:hypothetical protein
VSIALACSGEACRAFSCAHTFGMWNSIDAPIERNRRAHEPSSGPAVVDLDQPDFSAPGHALARLRGFAGFSVRHPLPINELAGKVCTTAGGE